MPVNRIDSNGAWNESVLDGRGPKRKLPVDFFTAFGVQTMFSGTRMVEEEILFTDPWCADSDHPYSRRPEKAARVCGSWEDSPPGHRDVVQEDQRGKSPGNPGNQAVPVERIGGEESRLAVIGGQRMSGYAGGSKSRNTSDFKKLLRAADEKILKLRGKLNAAVKERVRLLAKHNTKKLKAVGVKEIFRNDCTVSGEEQTLKYKVLAMQEMALVEASEYSEIFGVDVPPRDIDQARMEDPRGLDGLDMLRKLMAEAEESALTGLMQVEQPTLFALSESDLFGPIPESAELPADNEDDFPEDFPDPLSLVNQFNVMKLSDNAAPQRQAAGGAVRSTIRDFFRKLDSSSPYGKKVSRAAP